MLQCSVQSDVDLLVLRILSEYSEKEVAKKDTHGWGLSFGECAPDSVELKLVVDVSLLELGVGWMVDGR